MVSLWVKKRKMIISIILIVIVAWILGQIAVPALLKEIFLGGHLL